VSPPVYARLGLDIAPPRSPEGDIERDSD